MIMELLYIWIDNYNNLFDQSFLFSEDYSISFNSNVKKIEIHKNDNQHIQIFDHTFLNITAIVGINGSGKSSLFSLIKTIFSDNLYNFGTYIAVLKSDDQILILDKVTPEKEVIYDFEMINDGTKVSIIRDNRHLFDKVSLIFQSNSFTIYENKIYRGNYLNISFDKTLDVSSVESNRLLVERIESANQYFSNKEDRREDFERTKEIILTRTLPRHQIYRFDLLANVDFISEYKDESWSFIPRYIQISFNEYFFYKNQDYFKTIGLERHIQNFIHHLFEQDSSTLLLEQQKEKFKDNITLSFFLYLTIHDQYYVPRYEELHSFIDLLRMEADFLSIPKMIRKFLLESENKYEDYPSTKIRDFLKDIDSKFNEYKNFSMSYSNNYFFPLDDETCKSIKNIFDIWLDEDFVFTFDWQNLSAGEAALLNLFSRIKSVAKDRYYFNDTIWLLIDEGELYLHPEWQRTFFFNLHKFLPQFFKNKKIQLFFTSHSPFVVSDLPKENIIFLERDRNGYGKVRPKNKIENTFGANIHTLFTNTFFLENGLIGEFAKIQINELINEINALRPDAKVETKTRIRQFINMIGEPVLKNKLLSEYFKKTEVEEEIEYLNKRIKELENKRLNLKNDTDNKE